MEKTPCNNCGALILPATAKRNNGLCAKCKQSRPRTKTQGKVGLGIGIFFFVVGVALLCFGFYKLNRNTDAKQNWPTVTGTVVKAEKRQIKRADIDRDWKHPLYCYVADYEYIVNDKTYSSNYRVEWEENIDVGGNETYAHEIMNTYKAGSSIVVYYNPKNYNDVLAEPDLVGLDSNIWKYALQAFGGLFILLGGFRVFRDIRLANN